jgi:hypothetical protein
MMCSQTFIVKTLIIRNMNSHHIYMKQKERAREQDSGETERESVREWVDSRKTEVASVVKMAVEEMDHLG